MEIIQRLYMGSRSSVCSYRRNYTGIVLGLHIGHIGLYRVDRYNYNLDNGDSNREQKIMILPRLIKTYMGRLSKLWSLFGYPKY